MGVRIVPWLLNEDAAIKAKLSGLTVTSAALATPTPVAVRFAVPEDEYSDTTFPMIEIVQASVERDPERESRGFSLLQAVPDGVNLSAGPYYAEMPTPYNIDYQITLYTRLVTHRTALLAQLAAFDFLPARYGYLAVNADNTVRRLDVLGGPDLGSTRDQDQKRLFTATWRARVSTELFIVDQPTVIPTVSQVDLTLNDIPG